MPRRSGGGDFDTAVVTAVVELDASFFRLRFDRLMPAKMRYLQAMATPGPGLHRSGDMADALGVKVTTPGTTWNSLIRKGLPYSPAHGETAFTVPLFDAFIRHVVRPPSRDVLLSAR